MQQEQALSQSNWRIFPWVIAGGLGVVVAVNITLAVLATRSFPGNVGSDGFTLSNRYNEVIQTARHGESLGWKINTDLLDGRPRIVPVNRAGATLAGALVQVVAHRPLGDETPVEFTLRGDEGGTHVATTALPAPGQWDLTVTVTANGESVTSTHRVVRK